MTFASAVINQEDRTENGMKTRAGSASACVDLFYKIGASRKEDITPTFVQAYVEDRELAFRIVAWARDARQGAGERETFRSILRYVENADPDFAIELALKIPELGRWDDLFAFQTLQLREFAFGMIGAALEDGNRLAAKWCPRKGPDAVALRKFLMLSPKAYRKLLVRLTEVVETQMCAGTWDKIDFSKVPSVAAARYRTAFARHTPKYAEYVAALVRGDEGVKINADAVFPHDILRGYFEGNNDSTSRQALVAQWNALPNLIGDASVLPMADVSGSMEDCIDQSGLSAMMVAIGMSLYCADKNRGPFKDVILTFSSRPRLYKVSGDVIQKYESLSQADWDMSTDLHAALDLILHTAVKGSVAPEDMPKTLLIFSDMQFNACVRHDDSAIEMIRRKYEEAGYAMPKVVFWNLKNSKGIPVKFDESGTVLVSGYSPNVMKSVLNAASTTPYEAMLQTVGIDRYAPTFA